MWLNLTVEIYQEEIIKKILELVKASMNFTKMKHTEAVVRRGSSKWMFLMV